MKRAYFWMLFFFLTVGLLFAFASLYTSVVLYQKTSGQSLNIFVANEGTVSFSVEGSIDNTAPLVSVVNPTNTTYSSHRTRIDYTVSDLTSLDSCWYSLNKAATNVSITCGENVTGITSVDGDNNWRVYANDSTGNENSSIVNFVVNIDDGDGAGPGGGGGGTGTGASQIGKFELNPEEINLVIEAGERESREIKVKNTGSRTLNIGISVTGISDIVSADFNYLTISPGEERKIILSINAPLEAGIFAGRVIFKSGDLRRDAFVLVNVKSGETLFDISLVIPESFRIILPGRSVRSFISILQVGPIEQVDVIATYLIKDFDGNTLFRETETFFVLKNKEFVKEFPAYELPEGDYVAGIEVVYPGGFAASSDHFTISDKKFPFGVSTLILVLLGIIVGVVIANAVRKYKKSGRHRFKRK